MSDADGRKGVRPPHAATLQLRERPGAPPPHPATVLQRRAAPFGVTQARTPHAAQVIPPGTLFLPRPPGAILQRGAGAAQRAQQAPAYTGTNPITELQTMSEAFRAFAKVNDSTIQEVQAMWYKHATNDALKLAVAANNTSGDRNAVNSIATGLQTTVANKKKYPGGALQTAMAYLNTSAHNTHGSATVVSGRSHAEQNLLRWIAPNLTTQSVFYIAGTKDPCTQCQPRLSGYQGRLVTAGYNNMFTYHDGGVNQDVLERDVKDQIDYTTLNIP